MRKSEIFDSFVKIAQEKGLVSKESVSDKSKEILEKTRRADSLSIEDIAKLYNVKPDSPVEMHYVRNIVEIAHKNPFIIAPSYDKLHGLVENVNERQDITLNILNKCPSGRITQHKYAKQDLIMSLVRIANDLDNQNKDQLRILADTCLSQLSEPAPIKKTAQLLLIGLAAAVLGAIYAKQHMRFISDGFEKDHEKLINEIDDLLASNADWGVGYEYKAEFINMLNDFKSRLQAFYSLEKQIEPIINELQTPRDAKELMELAKHPDSHNVVNALRTFRTAAYRFLPYLRTIEKDFGSELYKQRQVEETGFFSSLIDKTQILHGGKGLVADDFDDVKHALETYIIDIGNIVKMLQGAESIEKNAMEELKGAAGAAAQQLGGMPTETETSAPIATPGAPTEESGYEELEKALQEEGLGG